MQLASEAKRDEVLAISIRGEPNQKSYQKEKEIHKNQERKNKKNNKIMTKNKKNQKRKRKKNLVSVVLDKMCIFCLYLIPDSQ